MNKAVLGILLGVLVIAGVTFAVLQNKKPVESSTSYQTSQEDESKDIDNSTETSETSASKETTAPSTKPVSIPTNDKPVMSDGYTVAQVAEHSTAASCWTVVSGSVYDLTKFIGQHPGGASNILQICGKDGTSAFQGQHGGQRRPENELAGLKIGSLKQ